MKYALSKVIALPSRSRDVHHPNTVRGRSSAQNEGSLEFI